MGTLPRIKLTRTDPFHHEISIQGLRLDDVALEIMRRHPECNYSGTPLSRTVSARDVLRVGDTFCLNFPSK